MERLMNIDSAKYPFSMTNDAWFVENDDYESPYGLLLTEEAPQEAIDSYNEFYASTMPDENGIVTL